ncbi:hypothetical protein [Mesorhizobium sp. M7A.F.Ca.MR.362.00.0.0]|uniref:hypothetical protein n=1 Tax=Mesorhizobium sp. M7A.F.Ca.MR.362.00.0.0 TaxID=2496779 RepID=UPI000FD38869|nr:hypothetical protein [Mesorhizobium sp. M7A.F.Ca.MR.362.00.0.0]RUU80482.1 hypothetical protein EOC06_12065 [Mesorhizobium sp. M7A.F.Ca.MR.362.00.0.0]
MARFYVTYRISGEAFREIEAESLEAAKMVVDAELMEDSFEIDPDESEVEDVSVRELHPVTRDGKKTWTTYPRPNDVRGHEDA